MGTDKVLVIGGGGREHAICLALHGDGAKVFATPGNPGIAEVAEIIDVDAGNFDALVAFATKNAATGVVVGPEAPLVAGIADVFAKAGIPCAGPCKEAAKLEASKRHTRELCHALGVDSTRFWVMQSASEIDATFAAWKEAMGDALPVVKADGLAAGKGVFLPESLEGCVAAAKALFDGVMGAAGTTVVLEERLFGTEASLIFACAGTESVALPHAKDHKRVHNFDKGPNTGGMGAISPNPEVSAQTVQDVQSDVVAPILRHLHGQGTPFVGFMFLGFMLTESGAKLLEINVRLGDPETQVILPRLEDGEFLRLLKAMWTDGLKGFDLAVKDDACAAVVLASEGYPDKALTGRVIEVAEAFGQDPKRWLIHAGTRVEGGTLITAGGRVAAVCALGESAKDALERCYAGVGSVYFEGMHYRDDIGGRG